MNMNKMFGTKKKKKPLSHKLLVTGTLSCLYFLKMKKIQETVIKTIKHQSLSIALMDHIHWIIIYRQ